MDKYVFYQGKKLRYGYTTGSCAASAAKAATQFLLKKEQVKKISINLPTGENIEIPVKVIQNENFTVGTVIKDGGDDPDITNGIEICAKVSKRDDSRIMVYGGAGVGRVTKKGLPVHVGEAAINPVPMKMIVQEVKKIAGDCGLNVEIYVPRGEEIAKNTLNSKLGIVGGISILGTSGLVKPMSEEAFKDSLALELKVALKESESKHLVFTFGNYGKNYALEKLRMDGKMIVVISNFVGFMIEKACEAGVEKIFFIGNIGKLVKVAGGIFHTHSRVSDARLEILASNAILCGEKHENILKILNSNTTEEAISYIENRDIFQILAEKARVKCQELAERNGKKLEVATLVFSNSMGELARSENF